MCWCPLRGRPRRGRPLRGRPLCGRPLRGRPLRRGGALPRLHRPPQAPIPVCAVRGLPLRPRRPLDPRHERRGAPQTGGCGGRRGQRRQRGGGPPDGTLGGPPCPARGRRKSFHFNRAIFYLLAQLCFLCQFRQMVLAYKNNCAVFCNKAGATFYNNTQ